MVTGDEMFFGFSWEAVFWSKKTLKCSSRMRREVADQAFAVQCSALHSLVLHNDEGAVTYFQSLGLTLDVIF